VDGLGRTRVSLSEADTGAGDGGDWVADGLVIHDAKGAVFAKHFPIFWGSNGADPKTFPLAAPVGTLYGTQRYDAFGRQVETTDLDGTTTLYTEYTALGSHMYDAAELENGDHYNTYATERKDGHGRTVSTF